MKKKQAKYTSRVLVINLYILSIAKPLPIDKLFSPKKVKKEKNCRSLFSIDNFPEIKDF